MKLLTDILSDLKENYKDAKVRDVLVGYDWTAVLSRNLGICLNLKPEENKPEENNVKDSGRLTEKTAFELSDYVKSSKFIEVSIGIAAINSLIIPKGKILRKFDALKYSIEIGKNKNIVMVGHFPHSEELRASAKNLWITEKKPSPGDYPAEAADYLIPKADIALITGATLVNKSLEHLLELCKKNKVYTIILGPSTVMSPVLFDYGANMLAGCKIINIDAFMKKISQGVGNVKEFKQDVEFIAMEK